MRLRTGILIAVGFGAALLFDTQCTRAQTTGQPMVALGYCQLATLSAAIKLSSCSGGIPAGANAVVIRVEAQAARYRMDATAPTASVGMPIAIADAPLFFQGAIGNMQFIEQTSGAKLDVLFFKAPQ